jgi:hypothetical protein
MSTDISSLALRVESLEAKQAKEHLDNLSKSGGAAGLVADQLQKQFQKLAAVLGPTALAAAFLLNIKNAISLQEQYVRLSEVAGTTASIMSSFELPARLSGTSLDSVATSIARLSKAIGEARLDSHSESAGLLKALGIDPKDGRDAAAVFVDVSKALVGMKDQNVAAAAALPLLSRGFAEMRPFMKEVVELSELHARATDEQLAASKRLHDDLVKLKFQFDENTFSLVEGLTPALKDVMLAITDTVGGAKQLNGVGEVTGTTLKGMASLGLAAADIFFGLGHQIGGLGAAIAAVSRGEFQIAFDLINEVDAEVEKHTVETNERIRKIWEGTAKAARGAATGGGAGAAGGTGGSAAEAAVRQFMLDKKNYEARIAMLTAFGAQYADQIKTANTLAEEAFKEGGIHNLRTQTELMQQQTALNADNLRQQAALLGQGRDDSLGQGNLAKAAEAAGAIDQINAKIVANEAFTQANIRALRIVTFQKQIEEYNAINQMHEQAGATLAEELRGAVNLENLAYRDRLLNLEMYLKSADGQIADAQALQETAKAVHENNLFQIERNKEEAVRSMQITTWQLGAELLQQFAGKSKAAAIAAIAINKALAIAQVISSTQVAIMRGYADLGPIGGSAFAGYMETLEAVQIGLIAATGLSQAASIRSAGGGASSFGGAGGGSLPAVAQTSAPTVSGQTVQIFLDGAIMTADFVEHELMPALQNLINTRDVIIMDPQSRNAHDIRSAVV